MGYLEDIKVHEASPKKNLRFLTKLKVPLAGDSENM